jgi:chorismate mutase/prephenate dehydrogenase
VSRELETLRAELDRIDGEILERVAARLRVVAEVHAQKRALGKRLFDRGREQEVLRRAEERAAHLGVSERAVRKLMAVLFEAAHDAQDEPPTTPRRVLIVGGKGRMGARFAEAFGARGHLCDVADRGAALDRERVATAEIVLVAVPMTEAERVTSEVAPLVAEGALLCDINSLKEGVCEAMRACPGEALGMHPMFGSSVSSFRRQKIIVCPVKTGAMSQWLIAELSRMGAEIVEADPLEHDRMMAVVQVLTHFGIMAMGLALARSGYALADTLRFMSPIYRLELSMVGRLFSQDPELYREIVMQNPCGQELRRRFVEESRELERIIGARDGAAFVARFAETRAYFASFSQEAMTLSDHIIDTVMSRA